MCQWVLQAKVFCKFRLAVFLEFLMKTPVRNLSVLKWDGEDVVIADYSQMTIFCDYIMDKRQSNKITTKNYQKSEDSQL